MKIELTFVEWLDPWGKYAWCYCAETWSQNVSTHTTLEEARKDCLDHVRWELSLRLVSSNLPTRGWTISETELIPPAYTCEKAIAEEKASHILPPCNYPPEFDKYNCFKLSVEVPLPKKTL